MTEAPLLDEGAGQEGEDAITSALVPTWLVAGVIVTLVAVAVVGVLIAREVIERRAVAEHTGPSLAVLSRATDVDASDTGAAIAAANALHVEGRLDEALAIYDRVLANDRYHVDALYGSAVIHLARGEKRVAEEALLVVLARDPGHLGAAYALGSYYVDSGRPTQALAVLESAGAETSSVADMHYLMGFAHEQLGDKVRAEASYRRALEYVPDMEQAQDGLWRLEVFR